MNALKKSTAVHFKHLQPALHYIDPQSDNLPRKLNKLFLYERNICLNKIWSISREQNHLRLERSVFLKNFGISFYLIFVDIIIIISRKYLVVLKFLLKAPKFKKNVLIYVIAVKKVRDLLLIIYSIISKMNEHRLLILINISFMINY